MIETLEIVEAIATPESVVCPSGVVSLYDVKQFYADIFSLQQSALDACEAKLGMEKDETQAHELAVRFVEAKVRILMALYESYGMESTTAQCGRIVDKINRQGMTATCGVLRADLKQLRERWEDEYKAHYFLHLEPAQARQYQNPKKDWESVVGRFHKVSYNIEESGKCYAARAVWSGCLSCLAGR